MDRLPRALSGWRTPRHRTAAGPGRLQTTIAAAAIAVPIVGLDVGEVLPGAQESYLPPIGLTMEMTSLSCRLADGSIGRIAIEHSSEDEWVAVCVPAVPVEAVPGE